MTNALRDSLKALDVCLVPTSLLRLMHSDIKDASNVGMPYSLKEKSILCGSVLGAETIRLGVYAGGVALYNILSS
ncbi:hypothetical protein J4225_03955 [Candidatus Pacearchaeota archaeon]|nr:hypothetical protein [Candidatus Pacearchaeota archaeon]